MKTLCSRRPVVHVEEAMPGTFRLAERFNPGLIVRGQLGVTRMGIKRISICTKYLHAEMRCSKQEGGEKILNEPTRLRPSDLRQDLTASWTSGNMSFQTLELPHASHQPTAKTNVVRIFPGCLQESGGFARR
jgi:hypothetical protein